MTKPRIGISACLLGQEVRYNGQHCRNAWILENLAQHVQWAPLCPEMIMGLGTPREAMRLIWTKNESTPSDEESRHDEVRLITIKTQKDLTGLAKDTVQRILSSDLQLDGFILKKGSPSCGLERVKVYSQAGMPAFSSMGLFAKGLRQKYPLLPITEEGRLSDVAQREHFLTQVFAYQAIRQMQASVAEIQAFHQKYKFLLLEHSPVLSKKLGAIAANPTSRPAVEVLEEYKEVFMKALRIPVNEKKRVNVLQHLFGFLKNFLDSQEKQRILQIIEEYRLGRLPWMAPVTLLRYFIQKFSVDYLEDQALFAPFPKELMDNRG